MTRKPTGQATDASEKRNAERSAAADPNSAESRNRATAEAEDDPQELGREELREKLNKARRDPAEG
jgi:hypothetical protein